MATESKAQPYVFDLGHLLISDTNPLASLPGDASRETVLSSVARDCAQNLINQLLSACPIAPSPDDGILQLTLPPPETPLPREKPVPKQKEKTKWERFAEKKGIANKRKDGKLVFDEVKKDWVPKYGYKGKKAEGAVDGDWLVEIDEKAERKREQGESNGTAKPTKNDKRRDRKLKARK